MALFVAVVMVVGMALVVAVAMAMVVAVVLQWLGSFTYKHLARFPTIFRKSVPWIEWQLWKTADWAKKLR